MAYSNGACSQLTTSVDGGYRATLLAKNFILTVSQASVDAAVIGHLEPREHPAEDREPLGVDETRYLLDHGHSFSTKDATIGWALYGAYDSEPPAQLADGQWDEKLSQTVLDEFQTRNLKLSLRDEIKAYRKQWVSFIATGERDFKGLALRDIAAELSKLEGHFHQAEKQQVKRKSTDLGLDSELIAEEDINHREFIHRTEHKFPQQWKERIKRVGEFVDMQLWRLKLLFFDDVKLVNNQNAGDALDIFKEEGEMMEAFALHYDLDPGIEHSDAGFAAAKALDTLLRYHHRVMAKARMLYFCEQIDRRLSARNTGWNILLA
ncbi:hypothetical protein Asppvi_005910 [Aspergillus pseudoviridinutans]|uniref:Uncharacterized protein n=1 Tax=Aspergillus pseudoviridinutans TaxID=1517512 RepID=A0A9P3ET03_9EURO|nr:uncharacterized protein Asppvi_005910 [Aspergillus pseudoviridinutans]GIJ87011.1 hypothetical protein Asppvi_005910 [Aspergillus pseudoviridinutans]